MSYLASPFSGWIGATRSSCACSPFPDRKGGEGDRTAARRSVLSDSPSPIFPGEGVRG